MKKKEYPTCLNCGKRLKPVKDRIARKITGHLWKCSCMSKNLIISRG